MPSRGPARPGWGGRAGRSLCLGATGPLPPTVPRAAPCASSAILPGSEFLKSTPPSAFSKKHSPRHRVGNPYVLNSNPTISSHCGLGHLGHLGHRAGAPVPPLHSGGNIPWLAGPRPRGNKPAHGATGSAPGNPAPPLPLSPPGSPTFFGCQED